MRQVQTSMMQKIYHLFEITFPRFESLPLLQIFVSFPCVCFHWSGSAAAQTPSQRTQQGLFLLLSHSKQSAFLWPCCSAEWVPVWRCRPSTVDANGLNIRIGGFGPGVWNIGKKIDFLDFLNENWIFSVMLCLQFVRQAMMRRDPCPTFVSISVVRWPSCPFFYACLCPLTRSQFDQLSGSRASRQLSLINHD